MKGGIGDMLIYILFEKREIVYPDSNLKGYMAAEWM